MSDNGPRPARLANAVRATDTMIHIEGARDTARIMTIDEGTSHAEDVLIEAATASIGGSTTYRVVRAVNKTLATHHLARAYWTVAKDQGDPRAERADDPPIC